MISFNAIEENNRALGFSFASPNQPQTTGLFGSNIVQQPTVPSFSFGTPSTQPSSTGFNVGAQQPSTQAPSGFNQTNSNQTFGSQDTPQQPTSTGFKSTSSSVQQPTVTSFGQPQQQATSFGFPPAQKTGFPFGNSQTSFFGESESISTDILIPKFNVFNFENNDFHDLSIEIHDENGLYTRINTHRLVVSINQGVLAHMVKMCPKKNDMFTLQLSTSSFPESKVGKIKALTLHQAINCYFESTYVKVDDIFQVLLLMDYLEIPAFQSVCNALISSFKCSQCTARSFIRSFNNFVSTHSLPNSNTTAQYCNLFREAFDTLVKGSDFDNLIVIKELRRDLFENQLKKEFKVTDLPTILNAIDAWISQNLISSPPETISFEIILILDNLQINQTEAIVFMIQTLSSKNHLQFLSTLNPEWKLQLINKYCNLLSTSTPQQQTFQTFQTVQQPIVQPIVQPPNQTFPQTSTMGK